VVATVNVPPTKVAPVPQQAFAPCLSFNVFPTVLTIAFPLFIVTSLDDVIVPVTLNPLVPISKILVELQLIPILLNPIKYILFLY